MHTSIISSWTPRPDQQRALDFCVGREAAGLFAKPGVGKTAISLETFKRLQRIGEAHAVLIIAPKRVMEATWPAEVRKWGYSFSVGILHGSRKDKTRQTKHDIYLINPEGLQWLFKAGLPKGVDTLIVDESTKFKNPQAKRFKLLRENLSLFSNRYILTGTPRPRSIEDLWAQIYLLDGGKRLHRFITHFRRAYMVDVAPRGSAYSEWVPQAGAVERIYEQIADLCITIESPRTEKPVMVNIEVPLEGDAADAYARMEADFALQMRSGVITAANAGVKSGKLRQLTGGYVYTNEKDVEFIHEAKQSAALEFIEEQGGDPLIVVVNYNHEAKGLKLLIERELGEDVPYFGGEGLKGAAANEAIERWNNGKVPVLLVNPTTAAHGLNLQYGGSSILWYSLTYNWEEYDQMNKRVDRVGQTKLVTITHLVATIERRGDNRTIDHTMLDVLDGRAGDDRGFFAALKARYA